MARPGNARADVPPSPHRGAPFYGSWFSTWAGDDTRPADQQTVLKSGVEWGDTINGIQIRHPILQPSVYSCRACRSCPPHEFGDSLAPLLTAARVDGAAVFRENRVNKAFCLVIRCAFAAACAAFVAIAGGIGQAQQPPAGRGGGG